MGPRARKTADKAAGKKRTKDTGPSPAHEQLVAAPAHYRLSPSSAARWLVCPYSAQHGLDDTAGPAAQAGTVAHEYACSYLKGGVDTLLELEDSIYDNTRQLVPNRAVDIARAATVYVGYVQSRNGSAIFETKIEHSGIPDFGGTIDTAILDDSCLSVVDLKTGKWKVEVENNPQIMSYLCLARQLYPQAETFSGTIVQPLVYKKPQTAEFSKNQLDIFEKQVMIAGKSDKKQTSDHCRFCPLLAKCKEGKEYAKKKGWVPKKT